MAKKMQLPPEVREAFAAFGKQGGTLGGRQGGLTSSKNMTKAARLERARKAGRASAKARLAAANAKRCATKV